MRSSLLTRFALVLPLFALQAACLAGQTPARTGTVRPQLAHRTDVVSGSEIRSVETGANAMEALRRLRPEFLQRSRPDANDPDQGFPAVYLDGVRLGGLETLRDIPAGAVTEIRYLRAQDAYERFGRYHKAGVIAVSTTR